jgi:predicted HAD superfamily hydrolase
MATYTFDIFDTLITRTTAEPKGIFDIMQMQVLRDETYAELPRHVRENFCNFRINAEAEARLTARNSNGREDITLEMVYKRFAEMNHMSDEMTNRLMALELATELENCVPITANIERLKQMKKENDVYLLSDMYLSAEQIRKLLTSVDDVFSDIPILVSGELNRTKASGKLYDYFLKQYHVDRSSWVHVGDHPVSDGLMVERPKSV